MKGFSFLFLCLLLSFSAIAESPPGFQCETEKIESIQAQPVAVVFDAATLKAVETDQAIFLLSGQSETPHYLFRLPFVVPTTPAVRHGNSNRSCSPASVKLNSTNKSKPEPTSSAKIGHESQPDFKVGWQGNSGK